jgi:4a-hydroxytetrahydrobiopterin dehydratase
MKPLSLKAIKAYLRSTPGWRYVPKEKAIRADLRTKDFAEAIRVIQRIARVAEKEGHHPDIHLTGYRHLSIILTTHAIQGLSINDFILAAKIEKFLTQK